METMIAENVKTATAEYEQACRELAALDSQERAREERAREIAAFERWQRVTRSVAQEEAYRFRRFGTPATDRGF